MSEEFDTNPISPEDPKGEPIAPPAAEVSPVQEPPAQTAVVPEAFDPADRMENPFVPLTLEQEPAVPAEEPSADRGVPTASAAVRKRTPVASVVEFVEILVSALVAAILILTLVCRTGVVDGTSMYPTMHHGDRYIISDLFYTPEQGDIVVFRPDIEGKEDELWIKRIIALEGQTVYIDSENFRVYVDGVPLEEPYLSTYTGTLNHDTENPVVVPEGCVYVLGDNRAISHDSRYKDVGCIPVRMLAGRVILRFWPLKDFQFYG